ncbi:ribonuclease S-6 [Medicago truncatula]|nr:ribonuclease S-6 [Medicago truncatula]
MHGLWPANRVISDPRGCLDKTNQKTIDIGNFPLDLKEELDKVWPDLLVYEKSRLINIAFWDEQWKAHGSCSNMDIIDFFKLSLSIYKKIGSLKEVLGKEGYSPGPQSHVEKQKIVDIIKKHTDGKASPRIKCEKHDGKTYLHEIQVCVDKTENHNYTNCRTPDLIDCEKDVYFP